MTSPQFDTYLRLEDAKKKVLAENDDISEPGVRSQESGVRNLNSRIIFTPKEDATYLIIATSFEHRGVGAYTLTIREFLPSVGTRSSSAAVETVTRLE
jgi:hypothetical protein